MAALTPDLTSSIQQLGVQDPLCPKQALDILPLVPQGDRHLNTQVPRVTPSDR